MDDRHTRVQEEQKAGSDTGHEDLTHALEEVDFERRTLFAKLGELLYPVTKDDETFFLMDPGLYLAISRTEEIRAAYSARLDEE